MLNRTILLTLVVVLSVIVSSFSFGDQGKPVFACNIGKLSPEQRKQLSAAIHRLIDAKPTTKELPNGYEMKFENAGTLFPVATTWIEYERVCCPFFEFSIGLQGNDGPMTIRLTGPEGAKEFIDDDLPALKKLTEN